jgi:hypothetical protein
MALANGRKEVTTREVSSLTFGFFDDEQASARPQLLLGSA